MAMNSPDVPRDSTEARWQAIMEKRSRAASVDERSQVVIDDPKFQRAMQDPEWRLLRDKALRQYKVALMDNISLSSGEGQFTNTNIATARAECLKMGLPENDMYRVEQEVIDKLFARKQDRRERIRAEDIEASRRRLGQWAADGRRDVNERHYR